MNTLGLRTPSGAEVPGENVYLIGPTTADIVTLLSSSISSNISSDITSPALTADIVDMLTVNLNSPVLTAEFCE